MMGGGFGRGANDSLKQNREPLSKEKRSFFKKSPMAQKENFFEQDHDLTPEEMAVLRLKLKSEARRERFQDFMVLVGILVALGVAVTIFLYLAGII